MNAERVDWFRIIEDLARAGITNERVAHALGVATATVAGWKRGSEPRYFHGKALLCLHASECDIWKTESDSENNQPV